MTYSPLMPKPLWKLYCRNHNVFVHNKILEPFDGCLRANDPWSFVVYRVIMRKTIDTPPSVIQDKPVFARCSPH